MGCLKLAYSKQGIESSVSKIDTGLKVAYRNPTFFKEGEQSKNSERKKNCTYLYPFGWLMPSENNEHGTPGSDYRFGYQGQFSEKDNETGWNSFEARMWDARIGRWLTTDPARQFASPYLGMGNNPVIGIDPDGEWVKGAGFWRNIFQSDARIQATDYYRANGGSAYRTGRGTWEVAETVGSQYKSNYGNYEGGLTIKTTEFGKLRNGVDQFFFPDGQTNTYGFGGSAVLIGGFNFEIGLGRDFEGNRFWYRDFGLSFGLDLSVGPSWTQHIDNNGQWTGYTSLEGSSASDNFGILLLDFGSSGNINPNSTLGPLSKYGHSYTSFTVGGSVGPLPSSYTRGFTNTKVHRLNW